MVSGWQWIPGVLTCVVVLGTIAQVLLIPEDELWERQALCHLHSLLLLQPLKDEVIHGIANWRGWRGHMRPVHPHPELLLFPAHLSQKQGDASLWDGATKHSLNTPRYSQLSSCMVHVWMSMGKFLRSMGQERISVSLEETQERRGLLRAGAVAGQELPHRRQKESFASPLGHSTRGEGFYRIL